MYKIAISVFPEVEELDFVGPFETFVSVEDFHPGSVEVKIVARTSDPVKGYNGLRVLPDATFPKIRGMMS